MANSVDLDQEQSDLGQQSVCICHFVSHFSVRNFRTFTINEMAHFEHLTWIIYTVYKSICGLIGLT